MGEIVYLMPLVISRILTTVLDLMAEERFSQPIPGSLRSLGSEPCLSEIGLLILFEILHDVCISITLLTKLALQSYSYSE